MDELLAISDLEELARTGIIPISQTKNVKEVVV
jgi:hypothetical protein